MIYAYNNTKKNNYPMVLRVFYYWVTLIDVVKFKFNVKLLLIEYNNVQWFGMEMICHLIFF